MNDKVMSGGGGSGSAATTPICRCRVLYLGSAVPHVTKDGLQGIQQPLRELYPSDGIGGAKGIDSWLSVWSNGLLLENVDERQKRVARFFPIEALHYCAAVRYVIVPDTALTSGGGGGGGKQRNRTAARFLPLDSPFARSPSIKHPPLFAAILRRTAGIKVLECHAFVCKREAPTNALVRCCFHAYGDSMHARQMGGSLYESIYGGCATQEPRELEETQAHIDVDDHRLDEWHGGEASVGTQSSNSTAGSGGGGSHTVAGVVVHQEDEDVNHKVWPASQSTSDDYESNGGGGGSGTGTGVESALIYGTTGSRATRPRQRLMPAAPPPPPLPPPPASMLHHSPDGDASLRKVRRLKTRSERDSAGSPGCNGSVIRRPSTSDPATSPGQLEQIATHRHQAGYGFPHANGHVNGFGHGHPTMNGPAAPNGYGLLNGRVGGHGYINGYGSLSRPHAKLMNGALDHASKTSRHRVVRALSTRPPPGAPLCPPAPPPAQIFYGTLPPPSHMQMVPLPPMMPGYGPAVMTLPLPMRSTPRAAEEPVYMPATMRPLSPTASYQPGHFPHDAYMAQQAYASVDRRRSGGKKKLSKRAGGSGVDAGGCDESPPSNGVGGGFCRRKNHLNEKAFGYSIRQEQRSRSYGSLANLENGSGGSDDKATVSSNDQLEYARNGLGQLDIGSRENGPRNGGYDQRQGSVSRYSQNSQRSRPGLRR